MPRVVHVKKARKTKRKLGIKRGAPYWYVKTKVNGRFVTRVFLKPPRPSQLTNSDFWSAFFSIQESVDDEPRGNASDFNSFLEEVQSEIETLKDETQEKFDNMPESLQQGSTGQLLEERVSALEECLSEIEILELDIDDPEADVDGAWSRLEDVLAAVSCE
jgi:hypothetical protein